MGKYDSSSAKYVVNDRGTACGLLPLFTLLTQRVFLYYGIFFPTSAILAHPTSCFVISHPYFIMLFEVRGSSSIPRILSRLCSI